MSDKATVLGERTRVSGTLEGEEDLTVRGRIDGSIRLSKTLVVESGGIVVADVQVKDCVVSGVVVGDVHASGSVQILNGGKMVGDIVAPRVIIVAGAAFRGRVDMGDLDADRPAAERSVRLDLPTKTIKPAPARIEAREPVRVEATPAPVAQNSQPPRPTQQPKTRTGAFPVAPRIVTAPSSSQKPAPPPLRSFSGGKKKFKRR